MFNGVVYQMLWTLLRSIKIKVRDPTGNSERGPSSALLIEPGTGGDLSDGRRIDQVKARSTGDPWGLTEFIEEVIPDLYRAVTEEGTAETYRFVTEGRIGPWHEDVYQGFFRSLRKRSPQSEDPFLVLDAERELPSLRRYKWGRALAKKYGATEVCLFRCMVKRLRKRQKLWKKETQEETWQRLFRLLSAFEIEQERTPEVITAEIHRDLASLGIPTEELEKKLEALCGALTWLAAEGPSELKPDEFFKERGLGALPLYHWARIVHRSRVFVERTVELHRYRREEDCRLTSPLLAALGPAGAERRLSELEDDNHEEAVLADRRPIILPGASGQGKSWVLYRTATELVKQGEVAILIDSTGDLKQDRIEVARQFCDKVWGKERDGFSLSTLARKVRDLVPEMAGRFWLTALIDGVQNVAYAEKLAQEDWQGLGIRVAVAVTTDGSEVNLEHVKSVSLEDFSPKELRRYLKLRLGDFPRLPPPDVMQLLQRPLLARLYTERVAEHGDWAPYNEYQLFERYWSDRFSKGPVAISILTEAAMDLLDGGPYPWPIGYLRSTGMGEVELDRLKETRLVQTVHEGRSLQLWHDRLLEWAVAEGLVEARRSGELDAEGFQKKIRACFGAEPLFGRRFGYVPMDVMWLLADPSRKQADDVVGLLTALEEREEPTSMLRTLGSRIVPHLFARLRELEAGSDAQFRYIEILEEIQDQAVAAHAAELLHAEELSLQRVAVSVLKSQGTPDALDRLWELYCRWRKEVETKIGSARTRDERATQVDFHDERVAQKALGTCVRNAPDWLERKIRRADPETEPIQSLVFLLRKLEQGEEVWLRVKKLAFEKVRRQHERYLAECIELFWDREELDWLEARVHRQDSYLGPTVKRALSLLAPERADALAIGPETLRTEILARHWWLPRMQLELPETAEFLLKEILESGEAPWTVAELLDERENETPPDILELLLDATDKLLEKELKESSSDNRDLHHPLRFLAKLSHPDLLPCLWRRKGSTLESRLTQWLVGEGPNDSGWKRLSGEAGRTVLAKIAGGGLAEVAAAYLESAQTFHGREPGFELALRRPDERVVARLVEVAARDELDEVGVTPKYPRSQREAVTTLAALGEDAAMMPGIIRWSSRLPPDFQAYLDGKSVSFDALEPALEALRSGQEAPPGAVFALGLSGRPEMVERIQGILALAEEGSKLAAACLAGLEALGDRSEETQDALIRALRVPDLQTLAWQAIVRRVRTGRTLRALLDLLKDRERSKDFSLIARNLLIFDETRYEAASIVWGRLEHYFQLAFEIRSELRYLAVLDSPEVRAFFEAEAFKTSGRFLTWNPPIQTFAIHGLRELDPQSALEAAQMQLLDGAEQERKHYPWLLLEIDVDKACRILADQVARHADRELLHAIGQGLDQAGQESALIDWIAADNPELRHGACRAAAAARWSQKLDASLLAACRDRAWKVREAALPALEAIRRERDVRTLIRMLREETDLARRWAIFDAALDLGDPGVLPGQTSDWLASLCEGLPYAMLKYADDRIKKRRKELEKDLRS